LNRSHISHATSVAVNSISMDDDGQGMQSNNNLAHFSTSGVKVEMRKTKHFLANLTS